MRISKTVANARHELYAVLATVAAKRAVDSVKCDGDEEGGDAWAECTFRWLKEAGARATEWKFRMPQS